MTSLCYATLEWNLTAAKLRADGFGEYNSPRLTYLRSFTEPN